MAKHSAQVTVDTDDNHALRIINNLNKRVGHGKRRDKSFEAFMRPIRKQLESLQDKMENALLDLETPLGQKGKREQT